MSSAIVQSISTNNRPLLFMAGTGLAGAAVQIIFLREYLTVFSGNELVIGVILGLWLLAAAAGSFAGSRLEPGRDLLFSFLYVFSIILGFTLLRASRLLFLPGEVIAPWYIPLIVVLTQSDAAFFGGFTFGRLARTCAGRPLYLAENAGAALGLLSVSLCVIFRCPNSVMLAGAIALFAAAASVSLANSAGRGRLFFWAAGVVLVIGVFMAADKATVRWKYPAAVERVQSGQQGEIALARGGQGRLVFLNNCMYRTGMSLPSVEQAVHLPAAMHGGTLRRALVIGNAGQVDQLARYSGLSVECLETEPLLAAGGCRCGTVETLPDEKGYDLILLGSGMPSSGAAARFYTREFFRKMKTLAGGSGVFSFTLPLSENYLSPQEQKLKDMLLTTLRAVFRQALVIPGEGYTFAASDRDLAWPVKPLVRTEYLEPYTLAALTPERVAAANRVQNAQQINTIERPAALLLAEEHWLTLFGFPFLYLLAVVLLFAAGAAALSPRTRASLSVGTSGFVAGAYSVALLLVYQCTYGTLYSRVSLLMIALAAGFVLGSCAKKFPLSDSAIGLYAALTLIALAVIPFPPLALFLLCHAGMGALAGAQFVTRRNSSWGGLYAADLAGGVLGMTLCSTLLVPVFGIINVAIGLGVIKMMSWGVVSIDVKKMRT